MHAKKDGEALLSDALCEKTGQDVQQSREQSREKIIYLLRENPAVIQNDLVAALHLSVKTIEKHIMNLKTDGIIRRVGPDKGGHGEVIDA